jgi:hypothetical protein
MDKQTTIEYLKKASANLAEARSLLEEIHGEYAMMEEENMPFEILDGISYDWLTMVEQVEGEIDDMIDDKI